jgi:formylglycine-generating enzyme
MNKSKRLFANAAALCGLSLFLISLIPSENSEMTAVKGGTLFATDPISKKNIEVEIKAFLLDKNLVTVADFEEFVKATHYVTEAEKFGNAGVFEDKTHEWILLDGADFRYPFGKDKPKAEGNHPVTQVSWNDAHAYAKWKGKRLPTQWEWEHAAKNGENTNQQYTWGESLVVAGKYKANTWQGSFPYTNTKEDGYAYTSPVGVFGKNNLGLSDMGGNVWQWCEDSIEPMGRDKEIDPAIRRVTRGGSFLCDPMVCHGFQVTGRSSSTPESSMVHIGFRCAKNI